MRILFLVCGVCAVILLTVVYGNKSSVTVSVAGVASKDMQQQQQQPNASNNVQMKETIEKEEIIQAAEEEDHSKENESEESTTHSQSTTLNDNSNVDATAHKKEESGFASSLPSTPFNMKDYDTIFLYHSRLAGGGILREWLGKVCRLHNITLAAKEGYVMDDSVFQAGQDNLFNPTGRTLYITSLRDPVDRAISSFSQEGNPDSVSFRDWVDNKSTTDHGASNFIWFCHSNCFSKWFGARTYEEAQHYGVEKATERLKRFHLVIRAEELHHESYTVHLQKLLDAEQLPVPYGPWGERTSTAEVTAKYGITKEDIELLRERNQLDEQLLQLAFGSSSSSQPSL